MVQKHSFLALTSPVRVARFAFLITGLLMAGGALLRGDTSFPDSILPVEPASAPAVAAKPLAKQKTFGRVVRTALTAKELAADMRFDLGLKLRNRADLDARIARGEILSRAELEPYLPTADDYAKVRAWLVAQGFTVTLDAGTRHDIFVQGSNIKVVAAFGVALARVATPDGEFTSAITAPSLPDDIAALVTSIRGLQPHLIRHPKFHPGSAVKEKTKSAGPSAQLQSQQPHPAVQLESTAYYAVTPAAVAGTYQTPTNLTGSGQTIAIIGANIPLGPDLAAFWSDCGVAYSPGNYTVVNVGPGPGSDTNDQFELSMDVEWTSGIAPAAKIRLYATPNPMQYSDEAAAYTQILNDLPSNPAIHQVTESYGGPEDPYFLTHGDNALPLLAAQGVSCFASSGDGGSNPDASGATNGYVATDPAIVEYPAADPYMTAVGGTTVTYLQANNGIFSPPEVAWSVNANGPYGTGGGISTVFTRPSWQVATGMPSGTKRCVPDISAIADTTDMPAIVWVNGTGYGGGGTSLSSPVWAGLTALINQSLASSGQPPVGLMSAKLYPAAGTSCFTDITSGNNGAYSAGTGYDLCTGLGTPMVSNLITFLTPVALTKVAAGRNHSLRLGTSSNLLATGANESGELGNGTTTSAAVPQAVTIPSRTIVSMAAGAQHTLILTTAGELWATGSNSNGQLGDNTTVAKSTPIQIATNVVGLAGGLLHSAFLKSDGTLWTMGGNDEGQLGTVSAADSHIPVQIATNVVDLAAGVRQTLFIKSDGTLWGTGDLYNNGTLHSTPIQLATSVKSVAAGAYHSLFVKTDGTAWALGYGQYYQLGNGSTTTVTTPVQVATGIKAVAAGWFFSFYIKTDNSLWSFGKNDSGQLGDTTVTSPRLTPYFLHANVTAVTAGEKYTLFTSSDGATWATGDNTYGQFGNGTVTAANAPVQIGSGTLVAPTAPSGPVVTAPATLDRLHLAWSPTVNAAGYEVWRNTTNSFGTATRIAQNVPWSLYDDLTATGGVTYYYWVTAVNTTATSAASTSGSGVYIPTGYPSISVQPPNRSVAVGATTTFTVSATGTPTPTDQWQRLPAGSSTWANVSNAGAYSGATTATLTVTGTTALMSGDQFRCVLTNTVGSLTSNPGSLTVTGALTNDFNSDGKTDIIWQNSTSGDRGFWLMNGTAYGSWVDLGVVSTDWHIVATADFNGDGKPDFLWENTVTGDRGFWLMNGTAFGSWIDFGVVSTDWHIAGAADFNGDGKPDILWENKVTGDRGIWLMNGTAYSSWIDLGVIATDWKMVGAADFNSDGKPDIVWENTVSGDRGFWLMNGTTYSSWVDLGVVGTEWHIAAVADYNGDGKTDILWESNVSGDRSFWLMNGTTYSSWIDIGYFTTDWHMAP